jgi:[protein-PII] uridylyltransferase
MNDAPLIIEDGPRSIPPTSLEVHTLRDNVRRHVASLTERMESGEDGMALGRANARFLNSCFRLLFEGAMRRAAFPRGIALAAVGSFGRGAVALRSDADVVFIVDRNVGAEEAEACAKALLYPLWDAGLALGHQVMHAPDTLSLAQNDLATATALLDLRLLAGDEALARDLVDRASEGLFGEDNLGAFIDRLDSEALVRRARYGDSVYLLEPDVKNGTGGLRDIDGARWAARARYRVARGGGDDKLGPWGELMRLGVLVEREAQEMAASEEFLWRVRNRLHSRAGRKADRLGFEDQEALALSMGYCGDRARAAERLMQVYYLRARAAARARASLLERLRPRRRRGRSVAVDAGGGVQLFDGHAALADEAELKESPALAFRLFAACVRQQVPVLPVARDAVARAADDAGWCQRLRASPEAAELFLELACTVPEARAPRGSVVGELHDVGLLLAMVPEFLPVTGRGHHDVYHVYTVDVHSVSALDRLRQLARGELASEFPLASRLAAEIARPRPLFLATLLHDIGKGWPDASGSLVNHSKAGAELCDRILPRLGVSADDVKEARQLVADHLLMYRVATARDLDDPSIIEDFCRSVRGREGLRDLYLLTVADVSTTSPTAMTSWKARMLDELYFAAEAHLTRRPPSVDTERVARARDAVRAAWPGPTEPLDALLGALPERYLLANRPESVVKHALVVATRGARVVHLERVPSRHPEAAELCIVADDRPGLLAAIAAAITASGLEVLAAQVYSHPVGAEREALDLFWVRDRGGGVDGVDAALPRLARDLEEVCTGRSSPEELLRSRIGSPSPWRERPSPAVPTEVLFDDRASPRHSVVEVYAKDRGGLLYALANALQELGLSITLSKINTEGARVADVFYVTESDGSKIVPGPRHQQIRSALLRAVGN